MKPIRSSLATVALALLAFAVSSAAAQELTSFVTREGDQLLEDGKPFRFISFNIPNLQMVEDNYGLDAKTPWRLPDEFELADALESVRQMGGTVVRTYVLSVKRPEGDMGDDVYVLGPGRFNEEAFRALDLALDVARKKGVRLIIPLVDNWKWQGGRGEYAGFRGKQPDDFWTDRQLIDDFKRTISFVLNRKNTVSGIAYKDDPAILCWETGNELDSTPEWTRAIAAYIKDIDSNHLVMDGYSLHGLRQASFDDPNVDIVTTHHYPNVYDAKFVAPIVAARAMAKGKKPYVVGEFGFCPTDEIERVYDAVIREGVSGALIWSLRFHNRDGGFYWHFEPSGGAKYKAYHWPGFESGTKYDERAVLELTRRKAYQIRGVEAPAIERPAAPTLLPIDDVATISWQGSAGARSYAVQRAGSADGPWETVAGEVDETLVQYRPLFSDDSAEPGESYHYRVIANNDAGASPPSNVVGPVAVKHRTLVDEGRDLSLIAKTDGDVTSTTGLDRRRREDVHRLTLPNGASVTYETAQPIDGWRAIVFRESADARLVVERSADGESFTSWDAKETVVSIEPGDYNYLRASVFDSAGAGADARFVRFQATGGEIELGRVEVRWGAR